MDPASQQIKFNERVWIGFDFDGTLAERESGSSFEIIGKPIIENIKKIKFLISQGWRIKIFTARVSSKIGMPEALVQLSILKKWSKEHIGTELEITCEKDPAMIELWDDRCVVVKKNTGIQLSNTRINILRNNQILYKCPVCTEDPQLCIC